ncbi:MAG: hypothetical protein U1C46_01805 [Bacteroidales bacterium]|nr:hypothetical protein [Bacteroidales bacterium]MDZ4203529.1 hypothetical protein [Bacteroidales bacterium]
MSLKLLKISQLALLFGLFFLSLQANGQVKISQEKAGFPLFHAFYSFQLPGHDLTERFGSNSVIGTGFLYKTKYNLLLGVDGGLIFSENVRNKDQYLENIATSEGYLISESGTFASVFLHERGFYAGAKLGGIIPVFGPNPNSGLMILLGGGILQHKIRIEDTDNNTPQVFGDYKKGYDRLTNGPSISQFIGYIHFDNTRVINFHVGLELIQAWTRSLRPWDFDRMQPDTRKRFDTLWGIRLGWILPLYKRAPQEYYYY